MSKFLRHVACLAFIATAAWVVAWAVPSKDWHLLAEIWGSAALIFVAAAAVPFLAVLLHELAHGLAAVCTGYRIYCICVWAPVPLFHVKVLGKWFVFGNFLRGAGYCIAYPKRLRRSLPLLYPTAGPLANFVLMVVGALGWARFSGSWFAIWLAGTAIVNAIYLVSGLARSTAWIAGRPTLTDGARMLEALRPLGERERARLKLEYAWGLAVEGRLDEAEVMVGECAMEFPNQREVDSFRASLLQGRGRLKEAFTLLEGCLRDAEVGDDAGAALALLLCAEGDLRNLERADTLSREVLAKAPGVDRLSMIRGIVLLTSDRTQEAKSYFNYAYERLLDPAARGYVATVMALYCAQENDFRRAGRYLRQALYLGARPSAVRSFARRIRQLKKLSPGASAA